MDRIAVAKMRYSSKKTLASNKMSLACEGPLSQGAHSAEHAELD